MTATTWPTIEVDAIDMKRAAARLVDELGYERCGDLLDALVFDCLVPISPRLFRAALAHDDDEAP
jgi:hypothetical protein